jgi:hypothetical protein
MAFFAYVGLTKKQDALISASFSLPIIAEVSFLKNITAVSNRLIDERKRKEERGDYGHGSTGPNAYINSRFGESNW